MVGGEFNGALPDEVREVKIFCFGRVGDGDANFAEMVGQQRPPDVQAVTLGVHGGVLAGEKSNFGE